MAVTQLLPNVYQQFFGITGTFTGLPLAGGSLYSYAAGTMTPQATYTDETGVTANTNPVVLNSAGAANVWLSSLAYKFVLKDSNGVTQWTVDNVSYINPDSIGATQLNSSIAGIALVLDASGELDVQVDSATMQVNVSNQLAVKSITGSNIKSTSQLEIFYRNVRDLSCPGLITPIPQVEWSSPTQLGNPGTIPGAGAIACAWSPNGEFLAVAAAHTPYVYFYQRIGNVLNYLSGIGAIGSRAPYLMAWSPCGDFLAVGGLGQTFSVLQRIGNSFTSNAASIASTINGAAWHVNGLCWAPNSDFLMVAGFGGSSGISVCVLERDGITFTDVTSTSTITGAGAGSSNGGVGPGNCAAFSADSSVFLAIDSTTNEIDAWSRADNVFTGMTAPVTSTYANEVVGFSFSPDGNFLAVIVSVSPYILFFSLSGVGSSMTFTPLSNPATLPAGIPNYIGWSMNGEYAVVGHATTPFMTIYSLATGAPVKIADPGSLPAAAVMGADWTSSKELLAIASGTSPYLQTYQTASVLPSNGIAWNRQVPNL